MEIRKGYDMLEINSLNDITVTRIVGFGHVVYFNYKNEMYFIKSIKENNKYYTGIFKRKRKGKSIKVRYIRMTLIEMPDMKYEKSQANNHTTVKRNIINHLKRCDFAYSTKKDA